MSDKNWNFDEVAGFVYSTKLKINIYKESTDNLEHTGLDLHRDAVSVEGEMGDEGVVVGCGRTSRACVGCLLFYLLQLA